MEEIHDLLKLGFTASITKSGGIDLKGFYKSGGVTIYTNAREIHSRYNRVTPYREGDLLPSLLGELDWWYDYSRDKFSGWEEMSREHKSLVELFD